ncbi:hypothetical protein [Cellulomonas soli]|uniref:Uncharacterized protein n=1 Tax=Cellulomonas soli TaxID=931535 RepID=A0A512PHN7_9CELL|nr:hypothetical protein [Cellulomonas soli]NYI59202.1 hypothetical protein [Cellulomonas soli]GEP70707.1 hypothetical protein CSO01_34220 [Cellulomonas soli]
MNAVVSELLAAAVVVAVDVCAVDLAPGAGGVPGSAPGLAVGTGTIEVELVEVVKGRVHAAPGEHVRVPVSVTSNADLWASVHVGDRLVAFTGGGSTDLAVLLTPEHCTSLRPAGAGSAGEDPPGVLADVRLARAVQRRSPTVDRLLAEAHRRRGEGGAVFARYVWVAVRDAVRADAARFDMLMGTAEDPGTRLDAQQVYLVAAFEDMTFGADFPADRRARLVRAMLRVALDPRVGEWRAALLGTYVPALVRAPLPTALVASDVFSPATADLRDAVRTELGDPRDPATDSSTVLAWLDADASAGRAGSGGGG